MLSFLPSARTITCFSAVARILTACACGALIGLERSSKNRPAGFRTHMLVCIGAASASLTGHYIYLNMGLLSDMTRIGAQVITGLGFIGAGTILVTKKGTVKGLTTAAGLWAAGVAGLAIGAGFYEGGILATIMILLVELLFSRVNKRIRHFTEYTVVVRYDQKRALDQMMRYCKDLHIMILALQISGAADEEGSMYSASLTLRPNSDIDREVLLDRIRAFSGVISAEVN